MEKKISETYFLSAGDTNANGELSLLVLTSKIIDIATSHANSLGIGNPAMEHLGAGWILARLTIEIKKYPKANSYYRLSTWIESFNRHFSERCFSIETEGGEICGYARSVWMVMDTVNRCNLGLSHLSLPETMILGEGVPIERQAKHFRVVEALGKEPHHGEVAATTPVTTHTFQYCDLDAYRHVNTVRYVALLLNQYPLEEYDRYMVDRLELSFLHEARYGEKILIHRREEQSDKNADGLCLTLHSSISLTPESTPDTAALFARLRRTLRRSLQK